MNGKEGDIFLALLCALSALQASPVLVLDGAPVNPLLLTSAVNSLLLTSAVILCSSRPP